MSGGPPVELAHGASRVPDHVVAFQKRLYRGLPEHRSLCPCLLLPADKEERRPLQQGC